MTNLKDYIDFAITLKEMDEVKSKKFYLPKEITFGLGKLEHLTIQTQVHDTKGIGMDSFVSKDEFTVSIFDIDFKFIRNGS